MIMLDVGVEFEWSGEAEGADLQRLKAGCVAAFSDRFQRAPQPPHS